MPPPKPKWGRRSPAVMSNPATASPGPASPASPGSVPADSQNRWIVVPDLMASPSKVKSAVASRVTQVVVGRIRMTSSTAAGTTIHLFCESAGTDPGDAGDAGSGDAMAGFDITAGERRPHFGFGGGIHYCLGHYVARTDMCEALTVLARRLRDPRPAGQAAWLPDSGNTGPVRLPVAFTPGH